MEKKFIKDTPLYQHDATYARKHDELPQYRISFQENISCKEVIEKEINSNYKDGCLDTNAVMEAISVDFSVDCIAYVLANTVRLKDWDGRISRDNKLWAKSISIIPNPDPWGGDRNCYFAIDQAHAGLVDLFVTYFRKEIL